MTDIYASQIARVRQKLVRTSGAWLNPPASTHQVETAEHEHDVTFPDAYRRFLLEVGDGGWLWTWPLYPLAKALSMVEGRLRSSFPFVGDLEADEATENLLFDAHLEYDLDGAFAVFYSGCTHYDILVMNGPLAGIVLYDGRGTDQGFIPYAGPHVAPARPNSEPQPLDYLSWFEQKLDRGQDGL